MKRLAFVLLIVVAQSAFGQQAQQTPGQSQPPPPTAEELAFARLPADVRAMLSDRKPAEAMQAVSQTNQQLIALGVPNPSPEQFRTTLRSLLHGSAYSSRSFAFSPDSSVGSASAGTTTFPPLSPLVPPPPPLLPQPLPQQR
jgi:hypothetical protein